MYHLSTSNPEAIDEIHTGILERYCQSRRTIETSLCDVVLLQESEP
jgi:hypothetical protein